MQAVEGRAQAAVPVDTGRLRGSCSVQAEGNTASISYDTPYAAIVHERGSKYLENALFESGSEMLQAASQAIRAVMG